MSVSPRNTTAEQETLLRCTMDSLLDPHVMLRELRDSKGRVVDFLCVDANRAAREHFREPTRLVVGSRVLELSPNVASTGLLEAWVRVAETGEPLELDGFEYHSAVTGSARCYDIRAVKVGDLVSTTWRDVTEWNELLKHFRVMVEHASDVVYQCDLDWFIEWVSPSVKRQLGWEADSLIGHRPVELIHPEDFERVNAYRNRLFAGTLDSEEIVDVRFRRSDGDYHWFSVKASIVPDEAGKPRSTVVSLRSCQREMMVQRALRTLSSGNSILVRATSQEGMLQEMCQMAVDVGGYAFSWFGVPVDDERGTVAKAAVCFTHPSYLDAIEVSWRDNPLGQGPTGTALRTGETVSSSDIANDARMTPWRDMALRAGLRSSIALPVKVDENLIGALTVYAAEPNAFDERAIDLLEDLASQLGYGMGRLQERSRLVQALDHQNMLTAAIDRAEESIIITNPTNAIVYANPATTRTSGYSQEELLGQNPRIFKSGFHDASFYHSLWADLADGKSWRGSLVNKRKSGELYEEYTTISPIHDSSGELMAYAAVKRDLSTERRLQAELVRRHRDLDAVSSIMRTIGPLESLEATAAALCRAMGRIDGVDGAFVILLRPGSQAIPIGVAEEFRPIADAVSPVYDETTRAITERTAKGSWWTDLRELGYQSSSEALARAREDGFVGILRVPVRSGGKMVAYLAIGTKDEGFSNWASTRIAVLDELGAFAGTLFGAQAEAHVQSETARIDVQSILDTKAYHCVFQPIVDLTTGSTVGYEALTRFDNGVPPHVQFIEASSVGLQTALEIACAEEAVRVGESLPANAWLSLNFSPETALDGGVARIAAASSRSLAIEVTEHVRIDDYDSLPAAIRSTNGVKLFVDDAGAGYAGLAQILDLDPDVVKLDISLVRSIDRDPARQALVSGMRFFTTRTGMTLLAEGVETCAEADTLRELGVDLGQGYLFGEPAPAPGD